MRGNGQAFAFIAAAVVLALPAWAASGPSADQIIDALKPTAQSLRGPTRGIRPLGQTTQPQDVSPAAAGSAAARPRSHQAAVEQPAAAPSVNLYVQFENGSAELTQQAKDSLEELGKALSSNTLSSYRFRIEGHTDTVGSREYNQALSEHRAASVREYIEQKFGVSPSRLVAVGLGSGHLLVATPDQTPEARNRRVQVVNIGA